MGILTAKAYLWTAIALSLGLLLAGQSVMATDSSSATPSSPKTAARSYSPGMMGPGMMYNRTPAQRQQHWEQMRQMGYGPGMMGPGMMYRGTPEQRRQHWQQMGQMMGYGPGMMMGPSATSSQ